MTAVGEIAVAVSDAGAVGGFGSTGATAGVVTLAAAAGLMFPDPSIAAIVYW